MNKSIILVMCDTLILSAMSLSNGGFSGDADDYHTCVPVVEKERFDELATQLKEKEEEIRKSKDEIKRANAETEAERQTAKDAKAAKEQAEAEALSAKEAEAKAKTQAEEAAEHAAQAQQEAEVARTSEAQAKAAAETAREKEALANAKAAEAQKREENAKVAEKAAREAEAFAKAQAEESAAREARAKKEAEAARDNEAHARADAALARQNEAEAKGRAEKATSQRNLAEAKADKLQAELDEIHARQNALVGNIPQKTIWKMAVFKRKAKKSESKTVYSPLFSLDGEGFLFVELPSIDAEVYSEVESVTAHYDKMSVTGDLYRLQGHDNWIFVKVGNLAKKPHIGFGVESLGIDGNRVFYPKDGKFSGKAVECVIDAEGHFTCSSKTENRNIPQQGRREHSVYKGCFLVSGMHGSIGAIVMEGGHLNLVHGMLKCEKIKPITLSDLLPIARDSPLPNQKD